MCPESCGLLAGAGRVVAGARSAGEGKSRRSFCRCHPHPVTSLTEGILRGPHGDLGQQRLVPEAPGGMLIYRMSCRPRHRRRGVVSGVPLVALMTRSQAKVTFIC